MEIRFFRDPETGLAHCLDHGVEEREVAEVFSNAPLRVRGRGGAYLALGQTDSGRYLKVAYRIDADGAAYVITAYDLRGKALAAFKRRRRRKGG